MRIKKKVPEKGTDTTAAFGFGNANWDGMLTKTMGLGRKLGKQGGRE